MDKIKLLALDFDGTTLNSEKVVTTPTLQAIAKAIDSGILVVPATGRSLTGIPKEIQTLDIKYMISKNGAVVYDLVNGKEIYHDVIEEELVYQICEKLQNYNCVLNLSYGLDYTVICCKDEAFKQTIYERNIKKGALFVDDICQYLQSNPIKVDKISCRVLDENQLDEIMALQSKFLDLNIMNSGYPFIEINSRMCSKGNGIKSLVSYLGLKKENVAAIGDSDNDIIMLAYANYSFAMGNATKFLKSIADEVVSDNNHDGVKYAIEKILERNSLIKDE
ncbi:MAG: Cof-type HAD-IIB family hydrolase [Erysipelotrichaceae bacterium]